MFDFGSGELLVIGVVALVVIGPKELPGLLRTVGQTVARFRRMAGDFQGQFQSALREAELHDAVKSISDIQSSVSSATSFNDPNLGLPSPAIPSHVTPPVELQSPAPVDVPPVVDTAAETKPKKPRAKKPKPADETVRQEDPQAALFDTLDAMTKKADIAPDGVEKPKKTRAVKSKPAIKKAEIGDMAQPKAKIVKSAARKPKTGEASS